MTQEPTAAYFFCRLVPPRPTFATDMTDRERSAMQEHVVYWTGLLRQGKVVIFGPVADPAGAWGLAVLKAADAQEAALLTDGDPAIVADVGLRYEVLPMIRAITGG